MADENRRLADAIRALANDKPPGFSYFDTCEVVSVNVPERTCDARIIGGSDHVLPDVRLMATVEDGFMLIPEVGSNIIVGRDPNEQATVLMCSKLQRVYAIVGDSGFEMLPDKVMFNDGSYGGMVIIEELVKRLNDIESKYNNLAEKWNKFCDAYSPGGPSVVGSPVSLKVIPGNPDTASSAVSKVDKTKKDDLENKTVLHGKLIPTPE